MKTIENLKRFLEESNAIEREYSNEALEDSIIAWQYAYDKIIQKDKPLDSKIILGIHRRLMKRLNPQIAGKFRKIQVGVMTNEGFKEAIHHTEIKSKIDFLCSIIPIKKEEIKQWHIKFEYIHPFEDCNGRTGRILMNIQRLKMGLPLLIIHIGEEQRKYYKWFKEIKQ